MDGEIGTSVAGIIDGFLSAKDAYQEAYREMKRQKDLLREVLRQYPRGVKHKGKHWMLDDEFVGCHSQLRGREIPEASAVPVLPAPVYTASGAKRLKIEKPDHRNDGKYQFVKGYTAGGAQECVHLSAEEISARCLDQVGPGTLVDDGNDLWWELGTGLIGQPEPGVQIDEVRLPIV